MDSYLQILPIYRYADMEKLYLLSADIYRQAYLQILSADIIIGRTLVWIPYLEDSWFRLYQLSLYGQWQLYLHCSLYDQHNQHLRQLCGLRYLHYCHNFLLLYLKGIVKGLRFILLYTNVTHKCMQVNEYICTFTN